MSNNYYKKHKNEFYPKYSKSELVDCANKFKNNQTITLTKILTHYFRKEMWKCRKDDNKLTPHQFINNDSLIKIAKQKIKKLPKFYHDNGEIANIIKYLANDHTYTKLVTQFPVKIAKQIYCTYGNKFKKNYEKLTILDTSSGFGSRLSTALLLGFNYIGIEPNKSLIKQLRKLVKFYRDNNLIENNQKCKLAETGSEIYYKQLNNTVDIAFTSPPYFKMEIYSKDKFASTSNLDSYENWLKYFLEPTIKNTYKYLKHGGYFLMNIRNRAGYGNMYDDAVKICKKIKGFRQRKCNIQIDYLSKQWATKYGGKKENIEDILCFQKL